MTTIIMSVVVILLILAMLYSGQRDGGFVAAFSLMRNLLGFLIAMTFYGPVASLINSQANLADPGPAYVRLGAFAVLYGVVVGLGRWLRLNYTIPEVQSFQWLDRSVGGVLGLLNGVVVTGVLLIVWSLCPFMKYLPQDYGRVDPQGLWVDSGSAMLSFYDFATGRIPGSKKFVLQEPLDKDKDGDGEVDAGEFEDLNENGEWDPGWLWRYRNYADIKQEDISSAGG